MRTIPILLQIWTSHKSDKKDANKAEIRRSAEKISSLEYLSKIY